MAIHPFQIGDLNFNFLTNQPATRNGGAWASEFGSVGDNINANTARYMKMLAVWADVNISAVVSAPQSDSYGQGTGSSDSNSSSDPWRPNGGYFVRSMSFTNTAIPPNPSGFRNGYIGTFVSGLIDSDYAHDPNNVGFVDYEAIYSHGAAVFPMTADLAHQWLDTTSSPADGTDAITNSSSALTRSVYIAPAYQILHIASVGANTLGSGNVSFMVEERPSLRMAGFNDNNGQSGRVNGLATAAVGGNGGVGTPGPYGMDPIRNTAGLTNAQQNFNEFYQVTGVRKLNTRGLSFHVAKTMDNGWGSFAYPFEEDGFTLGTGITLNVPPPNGSSITPTWTAQVNNQLQYTWIGGRDKGASITATTVTSNVITITAQNNFTTGQVVIIQGMGTHVELNGALLTVLATGLSSTQFEANFTHTDYVTVAESTGTATFNPDFRVRNAAVFIINEEYYGLVMDTKCTIWSNKTSMFPLIFFDLADTWTGSTAKRIAGVDVVPIYINATQVLSYQVFFLAEDGKFARYDFTQTNGVLELAGSGSFAFASNAPAVLAAGESYGALRARSTTSPITATSITANVLTVTCLNTFEPGEIVNITGTAESFLNNQTVTVSTATGLQFTAAFTHANYTNASDTGSAVGYSLWAVYGTMTPDPRSTQTALTFTGRVGLTRYLIGTGVWSALTNFSPNTGRHNGRSLSEMTVARDSKLYILCEDVTVTGGGPFNVSNASGTVLQVNWQVMAYDPVAVTWNTSKINGGTTPLQYGISGTVDTSGTSVTWVSGYQFTSNMSGQPIIINGVTYTVQSFNTPTSISLSTTAGTQTGVTFSYANMGGSQTAPNQNLDFWFYNINGFIHDVKTNKLLIQPNWTPGTLQILDVSGSTAALANANLSLVAVGTILPNDAFIPSTTNPNSDPFSVIHARDFATNGERTGFYPHETLRTNTTNSVIYLAPPSYNWGVPTALSLIQRNSYTGGAPGTINSFDKNAWSYADFSSAAGSFSDRYAWIMPTVLFDNQMHFVRPAGGGTDGLPTGITYGRLFAQTLAFLPTYWKWTGSAWTMADNFNDAFTNPKTVSGALVDQPLPYGLKVQFGPLAGTSYSQNEFHTFNMCWGNTKWARKLRSSWAQFAGQTFVQTDSRSIASQNALSMHLIDTDLGTVTLTAPTSQTPHTAVLTNPNLSWKTQTTWNKLDASFAGHDATPFRIIWQPTAAYDTTAFAYAPVFNETGSSPGPYSWTVNSVTYVATALGDNVGFEAWRAFDGSPQDNWRSLGAGAQWLKIDLGSAQTIRSYGFRPLFNTSDLLDGTTPKSWQLEGSATGVFGGEETVVDTRSLITSYNRGYAVNVATPGSFRYYRMNVSTSQTGGQVAISMLRLNTLALTTTCNFSDLTFNAYGSQVSSPYHYNFLRNWQMARGLKFEVSTTVSPVYPTNYVTITPLWRAHNGYVFSFPRQTAITGLAITVQHGFNYATGANSANQPQVTGFGPFYLIDYNVSQATIDAARLGNSLATPGTAAAGSFDPNCLGVATDVPNISIDGGNPSLLNVPPIPYTFENVAVHGFWDFNSVATNQFKMHPFFGFVFFEGAGPSGALSFRSGTTAVINYQWGRRI